MRQTAEMEKKKKDRKSPWANCATSRKTTSESISGKEWTIMSSVIQDQKPFGFSKGTVDFWEPFTVNVDENKTKQGLFGSEEVDMI